MNFKIFSLLACSLALCACCVVTAQPNPDRSFNLTLDLEVHGAWSTTSCNATCAAFEELLAGCITPNCGCTVAYLQAQGDCFLCLCTDSRSQFEDIASTQISLDMEISQCHHEKVYVDPIQLDLPPEAAAIVRKFYRDSASLRRMQTVFLALQIAGGHVGLVVILLFAISGSVRRDPTFINFCITWIFSSIVFSILLYRGTDGNTVNAHPLGNVSQSMCLVQAALTQGAQVMTAGSTLALIIQLWLSTQAAVYRSPTNDVKERQINRCMTYTLLLTPYVLFIVFTLSALVVGLHWYHAAGIIDKTTFSTILTVPANFYCIMIRFGHQASSFRQAVYAVTLGLLILTVIFDIFIVSTVYRRWWYFRHIQMQGAVPLSVLLRVIMFTIYRTVVVVTYGSVLKTPPEAHAPRSVLKTPQEGHVPIGDGGFKNNFSLPIWVDILQAALPLVAAIIFGANRELIEACMFWRKTHTSNDFSMTQFAEPINIIDSNGDEDAI